MVVKRAFRYSNVFFYNHLYDPECSYDKRYKYWVNLDAPIEIGNPLEAKYRQFERTCFKEKIHMIVHRKKFEFMEINLAGEPH